MQLANMFKKGINLGKNEGSGKRMTSPEVPEGILKKCNACKAAIFTEDVKKDTIFVRNAEIISEYMRCDA